MEGRGNDLRRRSHRPCSSIDIGCLIFWSDSETAAADILSSTLSSGCCRLRWYLALEGGPSLVRCNYCSGLPTVQCVVSNPLTLMTAWTKLAGSRASEEAFVGAGLYGWGVGSSCRCRMGMACDVWETNRSRTSARGRGRRPRASWCKRMLWQDMEGEGAPDARAGNGEGCFAVVVLASCATLAIIAPPQRHAS